MEPIPPGPSKNGVNFLVVTMPVTDCLPDLFPNAVGKLIPEMNVAPSLKMSVMPGVVG